MNYFLRLYSDFIGGRPALGLLLFRIVTGLALMQHGWMKIQHPMTWMGPDGPPGFIQLLAAVGEFGGGLGILLGFLTPLACFGVFCVMCGALALVHLPAHQPWIGGGRGGSFEPALGYLISAVMLFLTGPGKYSLDAKLFGSRLGRGTVEAVPRKEKATIG